MNMLQINFYPESDKKKYIKSVKEYALIWDEEGNKIIESIEKYSGLSFRTKVINAIVFEGEESYSFPLRLRYHYPFDIKKGTLIHELCHRLMLDNNLKIGKQATLTKFSIAVHKRIFLILYDVLRGLYGEKYAIRQVDWEKRTGESYEKAWKWALSFSKEERRKKFKDLVKLHS